MNALIILNIILAILISFFDLKLWHGGKKSEWIWIRGITGVMGVCWALIYGYLGYAEIIRGPMELQGYHDFVQSTVRPAITITLAILVANTLITLRGKK